jgi:D-aminopeptidase
MGIAMVDLADRAGPAGGDGSIMILIATDVPLSDRNLGRLAWRSFAGLARSGSSLAPGSGDYAIAFSTATAVGHTPAQRRQVSRWLALGSETLSPLC